MSNLGDQLQDEIDAILELQTAEEKGTEEGDEWDAEYEGYVTEVQSVFNDAAPDTIRNSNGELTADVNNSSTVTGELSVTGDDPPSRYLTSEDSVTIHSGNVVETSNTSWTVIFDIASAVELLGGSIYGRHIVYRVTIDGSVVLDTSTVGAAARTGDGAVFNAEAVPPAKADNSMKLEVQNQSNTSEDTGWVVFTR